jgi:hypothetical protein
MNRALPCRLGFGIYARNTGRGIAEDIFLSAETQLPEGCQASFPSTEHWDAWSIGNRRTLVSKSFPRLPPGSENMIVELILIFGREVRGDVAIDLTCGARNGPGVTRTITLPAVALHQAVEHYIFTYDNATAMTAADKIHEQLITECLANNP